ncbi:DDT domain-containing protein DDR4 [Sesamum indicum]|uniref:DDT domain-containing protein DDR4 n=1 Tax=Sesamum indicum TaxID=4182 RepID=A0A6I9TG33_SESIN|nr:DDT domain-containing protein DDR4 [Sesamum indicum]
MSRRRKVAMGGNGQNGEVLAISESTMSPPLDVEPVRKKLRERWELASVLNFLHVFEPVIGSDLKISAEDIETALIEQNNILAQLHIDLLKGILPVKTTMKSCDAWMIALSKTLSMWWPWVAEGDFPVTAAKGEEISIYKELEPTTRLLMLKALCEVRADQYDAVSYINETMKNGAEVSNFRKDKLASNGNGITFWYDGNETIGHRLYKEVLLFEKERAKGRGTLPAINSKWETLATNLEEFNKIVNEFSSSEVKWEVDLSKSVAANVIPVLEKQWKKKQRAQHRKRREQMLLNGFRNSGKTRSSRNHKPIDYRFDDYDRAITKAIQYTNKRKTSEERKQEENQRQCAKRMGTASNGSYNSDTTSRDGESAVSDAERDSQQGSDDADDSSQVEYDGEREDDGNQNGNRDHQKVHSHEQNMLFLHRSKGLRFSKRLAGIPGHTAPESMNLGAKNRLRQRPSVNTAVESVVVPDSEDESSSGDEDYLGN